MAQMLSPKPRLALQVVAPLFAAALVFSACSKNSDTNTSAGNATTTAAGSATTKASSSGTSGTSGTSPKGTTAGTTKSNSNLNTKVWFRGFRFDLGDVRLDSENNALTIDTKVTNLGEATALADPSAILVNGGAQVATGGLKNKAQITGGKTVDDSFVFDVKPDFTTSGTTFSITDGVAYQEVKVPLDGKGDSVTLEPVAQTQTITPIVIGNVTVTPKTVEVRYDIPNNHEIEADAGTAFLIIGGSASNSGTNVEEFNAAGITVTTDTGTYPASFIGDSSIPAGQTNDKVYFYFKIKQPVDGQWTLDMKDQPFGPEGATVSATNKITVTSKKSSTGGTTTTTN